VAALFGVSRTWVKKLLRQRRETGSIAPKPHGGGQPPKVEGKREAALRSYILAGKEDASLVEVQTYIARRWRVKISEATVSRLLARLGLPRKKNFGG
jgi:transposase